MMGNGLLSNRHELNCIVWHEEYYFYNRKCVHYIPHNIYRLIVWRRNAGSKLFHKSSRMKSVVYAWKWCVNGWKRNGKTIDISAISRNIGQITHIMMLLIMPWIFNMARSTWCALQLIDDRMPAWYDMDIRMVPIRYNIRALKWGLCSCHFQSQFSWMFSFL